MVPTFYPVFHGGWASPGLHPGAWKMLGKTSQRADHVPGWCSANHIQMNSLILPLPEVALVSHFTDGQTEAQSH